ncbi:DUF3971 domain-containing protein [Marinomonas sp. C2222]|uniref:DUF3971 domain-containing protein n=1 Tax=Marinomonas sargassi TaxID=2984494 RepID=A0ABT2YSN4_9GAMM|nr:AsmA-like C-terminal region-containing protein [Marinomonas sargassi]MCV2402900.1 DUF3971 domain-containing protein [Marinomonas sargassi]
MKWLLSKAIVILFWGAVFISSLGIMFALGFGKVLPYLDNYRPQIESNLQQIIGHPVSIRMIDGRLEGLDPSISVSGFSLAPNGVPAVTIKEMRIRLDLIQSILTLSPQFSYLRFIDPHIHLAEDQGAVRLKGTTPSSSVKSDVGVERVLGYLSDLRNVSILGAKVNVTSKTFGDHFFESSEIYVFQKENETLFRGEFYLNEGESAFLLNARLETPSSFLGTPRLKASVVAPNFSLPLNSLMSSTNFPISHVDVEGNIWLDVLLGKQLDLRSESNNIRLTFNDGKYYDLSSSLKLGYIHSQPSLKLVLSDLAVKEKGQDYLATDIEVDWSSLTNRTRIKFDQIDLELAKGLGGQFIPSHYQAKRLVDGLAPSGKALNGEVSLFRKNDKLSFEYISNLQSASVNAYQGIPEVDKINAVFRLSEDEGSVDFRGKSSSLLFEEVYSQPWLTESASGYVAWKQDQDFIVTGQNLHIQRNKADIKGDFRLEIRQTEPDWISLDLHGENIPIIDRLTYIPPTALDQELQEWIQQAFDGQGQADSIDVFVQSELSNSASPDVKVKLVASNLDVTFDESWPTAHEVKGVFEYDKSGVIVQIDSALLQDLSVSGIRLEAPIIENKVDWLYLKGAVEDDSNVILALLNDTPLRDSVLTPFENWYMEGDVKGQMNIGIPFTDQDAKVDVSLNFKDNPLLIKDLELESVIQQGQVTYTSEDGLKNTNFDIQAFGGTSHLKLTSRFTEEKDLIVYGDLEGVANVQDVATWQTAPEALLNKATGTTHYVGNLSINEAQDGQFELMVTSDLFGVDIYLPEPVGKSNEELRALEVKVMVHEDDLVVDAFYTDLLDSRFLFKDSHFIGGEVLLNSKTSLSTNVPQGVVLRGSMDYVNSEDWHAAFAADADQVSSDQGGASESFDLFPSWLNTVDLIVDSLLLNKDNTWNNLKVSYQKENDNGFLVSADEGNLRLTISDVPELHFGYLSWSTDSSEDDQRGLEEAPISASQIPDMRLKIDELYIDQQPYGDWQTTVSRTGTKVIASPITSALKGGEFLGSFIWDDRGESSTVKMEVTAKGKDLAELTGKFSEEAFISSESYDINVDLGWQGHPFDFHRESLSGGIRFQGEKGNFNQVEEIPAFLKALGIFNVGALSRRLTLDFRDVYEPGLSYDTFSGDLNLKDGILKTVKPIHIVSPSAELSLKGTANIVDETLDERLTATFPLSGTLPLAGLLLGSPQLAGILFLTDQLIGDQISKVTSIQYSIKGPFSNPNIAPVKFEPSNKKKGN